MHICIQYLRVALAFSHDNLRNGATYGVEILQADPRGAWAGSNVDRGHNWEENCTF